MSESAHERIAGWVANNGRRPATSISVDVLTLAHLVMEYEQAQRKPEAQTVIEQWEVDEVAYLLDELLPTLAPEYRKRATDWLINMYPAGLPECVAD